MINEEVQHGDKRAAWGLLGRVDREAGTPTTHQSKPAMVRASLTPVTSRLAR